MLCKCLQHKVCQSRRNHYNMKRTKFHYHWILLLIWNKDIKLQMSSNIALHFDIYCHSVFNDAFKWQSSSYLRHRCIWLSISIISTCIKSIFVLYSTKTSRKIFQKLLHVLTSQWCFLWRGVRLQLKSTPWVWHKTRFCGEVLLLESWGMCCTTSLAILLDLFWPGIVLHSHDQLIKHICMQNHNDDTIKTSGHSSLEKYTSHLIERVVCERELEIEQNCNILTPTLLAITAFFSPRSPGLLNRRPGGPNSLGVGFLYRILSPTATAQSGTWGPTLLGAGFLYHILSPTDWTSCAPSYIIVRRPPPCGRHKSHSFNPSTVKVIFWYSSTGCTCYLHWCISYFDSLARSEVNIQQ